MTEQEFFTEYNAICRRLNVSGLSRREKTALYNRKAELGRAANAGRLAELSTLVVSKTEQPAHVASEVEQSTPVTPAAPVVTPTASSPSARNADDDRQSFERTLSSIDDHLAECRRIAGLPPYESEQHPTPSEEEQPDMKRGTIFATASFALVAVAVIVFGAVWVMAALGALIFFGKEVYLGSPMEIASAGGAAAAPPGE